MPVPGRLAERSREVQLVIVDVDGVLTDGVLLYGPEGETLKAFHARDGLGLKLLMREGIAVAVISGRRCAALERRLADLRIERAYLGCEDKAGALAELLSEVGCTAAQALHIGDDLPDLAVFERVGIGVAVADAHPRVQEAADWVLETRGGQGAAREMADALLAARGRLEPAIQSYLSGVRGAG